MEKTILINNPANIWVGKVINDKYKIMSLINTGASSDVYLCENLKIGNKAVVKILAMESNKQFDFSQEIDVLAKIHHPNMPYIIDFFKDKKHVYIFETYIDGITLEEKLKMDMIFSEATIIGYFEQLLDIIKYLHSLLPNPIIYKDIKPSNIIVNKNDKLYLIDFGISKIYNALEGSDRNLAGTKNYAAPEQWNVNKNTDERTDIYSLGALIYRIVESKVYKKSFENMETNINISDELKCIIKKCLIEDAEKRYQSVEEIIIELEEIKNKKARMPSGKKIFLVDGVTGAGKSTILSGLANIYSKNKINTTILDMSDKFGITLFWDAVKTQMMEYVIDSDDYDAIKKVAIKPNRYLFVYKMRSISEENIIMFINKVLKFSDIVFIECGRKCTKRLYDYAHQILLVSKQEEKYMFGTMQILNKYIKCKTYIENIKIIINDYIDIAGEEEHLIKHINIKLKTLRKKTYKNIDKIHNIKRKNFIDALQKGQPIYTNDDVLYNGFLRLAETLYQTHKKTNVFDNLKEGIAKWLTREKMKK
ncbi:MAG TPA: hypothetical protein DCP90_08595 [Clostridiales bacterium]|nr:MAG: hypothetical protein A2Y22_05830 [Clostridiales bacterium GWD2_32_59]HAN10652.1 hypothetical protein [Clostridiales bacterium]